jgi:ribosomal protein S12 methylthiotransferase accessory factor
VYEVIERDAVTCWRYRARVTGQPLPRVDPATIPYDLPRELFDRFAASELHALLFDLTIDTAVPTYLAYLIDATTRHVGMCRGYGTHLDPAVAMSRALTEAAQSRVGLIAGARDDRLATDHHHARRADQHRRVASWLGVPLTRRGDEHPDGVAGGFADDLRVLLDRLSTVGVERVGVLDLTHPELDIPVVRVHAPGLEGYLTWYHRPGRRALAFAGAAADALDIPVRPDPEEVV